MQKWKEEQDNRRQTEEEQWRKYWRKYQMQKERTDGILETIRLAIGRGNYGSATNKEKMYNGA